MGDFHHPRTLVFGEGVTLFVRPSVKLHLKSVFMFDVIRLLIPLAIRVTGSSPTRNARFVFFYFTLPFLFCFISSKTVRGFS